MTSRPVVRFQRGRGRLAMTDNNDFGKMAQDLTIGQAVWMTPGGEVHKLAVPNCTERDLEMVATHLGAKTGAEPTKTAITPVVAPSQAPSLPASQAPSLAAKERRILDMPLLAFVSVDFCER